MYGRIINNKHFIKHIFSAFFPKVAEAELVGFVGLSIVCWMGIAG